VSLINEALRKARQAASEHDSKQPEGAFQPAKAYPSRRSGRGGGWLAVCLIAIVAAAIGAGSVWWLTGDRDPEPIEVAAVPPIPAHAESAEVPSVASPTSVEVLVVPTEAPAPTPTVRSETIPVTQFRETEAGNDNVSVGASPEEPTPTSYASRPGERIYVMEAHLNEITLSLGYIVARSENPFAEINGTDVYVGSEIEGFVVEVIEPDRVVLRDDQGPLELRVP
jgi:hypothetical protein